MRFRGAVYEFVSNKIWNVILIYENVKGIRNRVYQKEENLVKRRFAARENGGPRPSVLPEVALTILIMVLWERRRQNGRIPEKLPHIPTYIFKILQGNAFR